MAIKSPIGRLTIPQWYAIFKKKQWKVHQQVQPQSPSFSDDFNDDFDN